MFTYLHYRVGLTGGGGGAGEGRCWGTHYILSLQEQTLLCKYYPTPAPPHLTVNFGVRPDKQASIIPIRELTGFREGKVD